jgi:integrase
MPLAFRQQDGTKAIHLNAPALALLQTIPRIEGNPHVICGDKPGQHLVNLEKPWRRICKAAKLDDVRLHDLRHSFASVAASGGQSLVVIGKMLGHSQLATTARYAHLADDPVKAASESWADRLLRQWMASRAAMSLIYRDRGEQRVANSWSPECPLLFRQGRNGRA